MSLPSKANIFLKYPGWTAGLLTLLCLMVWRWWTGFNGLYGQDSYAYLEYGRGLQDWMAGGDLPGEFFWPGGYSMVGALMDYVVGDLTMAFQLISMLSMALTVGFLTSIGSNTLPNGMAILVTIGCVAFSPYLLRSGLSCMSDALAVAVLTGTVSLGQRYREKPQGVLLVAMVFLLAFGTWVRYPVGILLGGVLLVHLPIAWRNRHFLPLITGGLLATIPILLHLKLQSAAIPNHHFLEVWSPGNWFKRSYVMKDGAFSYRLPNLGFTLGPYYHPGYLGLATLLLPLTFLRLRRYDQISKAYLVLTGLFILFIAGIPFQNTRFLVVLIPLCTLNFFNSKSLVVSWLSTKWKSLRYVLLGIVILNIGIIYYANAGFWGSAVKERGIVLVVEEYMSSSGFGVQGSGGEGENLNQIYTFGMDGALKHYLPDAMITNLWNEELSTLEWISLHDPVPKDLVLFNKTRFKKQWAGKSPMLNWEYLNQNYHLDSLATLEGGWTLHEIH